MFTTTFYFLLNLFVFAKQLPRKIGFKLILSFTQKGWFTLLLLMNGLWRTVNFISVKFENKYPLISVVCTNCVVLTNQLSQFFLIIIKTFNKKNISSKFWLKIDFKLILSFNQKYCFILLMLMNSLLQRSVIFMTVQFKV